jgi:hypothetical protein
MGNSTGTTVCRGLQIPRHIANIICNDNSLDNLRGMQHFKETIDPGQFVLKVFLIKRDGLWERVSVVPEDYRMYELSNFPLTDIDLDTALLLMDAITNNWKT